MINSWSIILKLSGLSVFDDAYIERASIADITKGKGHNGTQRLQIRVKTVNLMNCLGFVIMIFEK